MVPFRCAEAERFSAVEIVEVGRPSRRLWCRSERGSRAARACDGRVPRARRLPVPLGALWARASIPVASSWTVIATCLVAILDRRFVRRTATFPAITIAIDECLLRRISQLARMMGCYPPPVRDPAAASVLASCRSLRGVGSEGDPNPPATHACRARRAPLGATAVCDQQSRAPGSGGSPVPPSRSRLTLGAGVPGSLDERLGTITSAAAPATSALDQSLRSGAQPPR